MKKIVAVSTLVLMVFVSQAFADNPNEIIAHGICEYNDLPEDFNGTPPQDRRDFNAGEEVCSWLVVKVYNPFDLPDYEISSEWYQPDGSQLIPVKIGQHTANSIESEKLLMSQCLETYGEEGVIGIPNIPGEWMVESFDEGYQTHMSLYKETFTVIGDGGEVTTTTTSENLSSTTTTTESTTTTSTNSSTTSIEGDTSTTIPVTTSIPECSYGSCVSTSECTDALGSGWVCNNGCCVKIDDGSCPSSYLLGQDDPQLDVLRDFRDNVLTQSPAGQELIKLYYQWSHAIVLAMEEDEAFKEEVKELLDGVLEVIGGGME